MDVTDKSMGFQAERFLCAGNDHYFDRDSVLARPHAGRHGFTPFGSETAFGKKRPAGRQIVQNAAGITRVAFLFDGDITAVTEFR